MVIHHDLLHTFSNTNEFTYKQTRHLV